MSALFQIWTDGGITKKDGPVLGFACVLRAPDGTEWEVNDFYLPAAPGEATNQVAELRAFLLAAREYARWCREHVSQPVRICSDSEWCVETLRFVFGQPSTYGKCRTHVALFEEVAELLAAHGLPCFQHVGGHADKQKGRDMTTHPYTLDEEMNMRCDRLAQEAVERGKRERDARRD